MRDRRGLDEGVAGLDMIDVGEVGHGHGHEHAVGQDRAFGPAGGAARVEQPRGIGRRGGRHVDAGAGRHRLVGEIADAYDGLEGIDVVS